MVVYLLAAFLLFARSADSIVHSCTVNTNHIINVHAIILFYFWLRPSCRDYLFSFKLFYLCSRIKFAPDHDHNLLLFVCFFML
jgi:hypothetical protein